MGSIVRPVFLNPAASAYATTPSTLANIIGSFHRQLPDFLVTPLVSLDEIAKELGFKAIYIKDESLRAGLPSFKILGASWGTYKTIIKKFGLSLGCELSSLREVLRSEPVTLYAATDGNHGRAVARMGSILGMQTEIFVPGNMYTSTKNLIAAEGALVTRVSGNYDDAVQAALVQSQKTNGLFVQDTAFEGYEEIPNWIVEGYSTMFSEIDEQLGDLNADLVVTPVGVGSLAQSVVMHYKAAGKSTSILTVEADTAPCFRTSLSKGEMTTVTTTQTIMAGLDCGTVSSTAWPFLQHGVDASVTVSDYEAHQATKYLDSRGVLAGPCGAATLVALRRLTSFDKQALKLNENSIVILLCTEGKREYVVPRDVSQNDAGLIAQTLVQINSASPSGGGPGELEVARYIAAWLEHRNIETHWIEPTPGRPTVVGVLRGTGGGKSLMLNGHIDTVTIAGYDGDPLEGNIKDGRLYGRGSADMKSGVAAYLGALAELKKHSLLGTIIFAGVADEEDLSIGTEQLLQAGWRADGALISEPSNLEIVYGHKGFVWFEVDINGLAAHGSRPDLGIDSISKAGHFLVELDRYALQLQSGPKHPKLGYPSVHASMIKGGEETASYPAKCTITIERRTVAGETDDIVTKELESILKTLANSVPNFKYSLRRTFSRSPFEMDLNNPFVSLVKKHVETATSKEAVLRTEAFWTDCALLADVGIPVVMFGPVGEGLHSKEEWANMQSIKTVADATVRIALDFCK
jgi:acetylornithine deacetylase/succinyl-diaminopimelate desuccinylase family protein/diaminopropionate ammonia-lyase family